MTGIRIDKNEAAKLRAMAGDAVLIGHSKKLAARLLVEVYDDGTAKIGMPGNVDEMAALIGRAVMAWVKLGIGAMGKPTEPATEGSAEPAAADEAAKLLPEVPSA